MSKRSTLTRRLPFVVGLLALVLTASGCLDGDPGGPMTAPTTGSIQATATWPGSSGVFCIDDVTFTYSAVNLTGNEGEMGPIVHSHVNRPQTLPTNGLCRSNDVAAFLRFGTWRVSWLNHSCVIDIRTQPWVIVGSDGNCQTHI